MLLLRGKYRKGAKAMKVLIIGGVAAGTKAAAKLKKRESGCRSHNSDDE